MQDPVRRRTAIHERRLERLGDTVVDLTALVDALVPRKRAPAKKPAVSLRPVRPPRKKARTREGPPPDGDALFDANQCDFGSLVKKLDEVIGD